MGFLSLVSSCAQFFVYIGLGLHVVPVFALLTVTVTVHLRFEYTTE